jgi:hypothetical protein
VRALALVLAGLLLAGGPAGCGWYYLEPDPAALQRGAAAPAFSLSRAGGGQVTLDELRARGHAVLVFYRGKW